MVFARKLILRELVKYFVKPRVIWKFKSPCVTFSLFFLYLQVPKASLPSPSLPFPCFPTLSYIQIHSFISKKYLIINQRRWNRNWRRYQILLLGIMTCILVSQTEDLKIHNAIFLFHYIKTSCESFIICFTDDCDMWHNGIQTSIPFGSSVGSLGTLACKWILEFGCFGKCLISANT